MRCGLKNDTKNKFREQQQKRKDLKCLCHLDLGGELSYRQSYTTSYFFIKPLFIYDCWIFGPFDVLKICSAI